MESSLEVMQYVVYGFSFLMGLFLCLFIRSLIKDSPTVEKIFFFIFGLFFAAMNDLLPIRIPVNDKIDLGAFIGGVVVSWILYFVLEISRKKPIVVVVCKHEKDWVEEND